MYDEINENYKHIGRIEVLTMLLNEVNTQNPREWEIYQKVASQARVKDEEKKEHE